jgi:hypothetical protein
LREYNRAAMFIAKYSAAEKQNRMLSGLRNSLARS